MILQYKKIAQIYQRLDIVYWKLKATSDIVLWQMGQA